MVFYCFFAINILNIFRDMVPKFRTLLCKCGPSSSCGTRMFVQPCDQLVHCYLYSKVRWGLPLHDIVFCYDSEVTDMQASIGHHPRENKWCAYILGY